jgi:hypothetical protein
MTARTGPPALVVAVLLWAAVAAVPVAAQPAGRYAGRALADVLRDLQARGLEIVFSTALVRPDMRVATEPRASTPRKVLDEVVAPHGLRVESGPKGLLLIVRARRGSRDGPAPPAATGAIAGRVVDKRTGAPLPGVTVTVQGTSLTTVTAADGGFRIADVPAEPHWLFVSLVGFGLARPVVNVEAGGESRVEVALADGVGVFTDQVTVVADRFRPADPATPSLATLTNADLQDLRGVLADDPLRAVQALPAAASGDDFRSEFSVRGSPFRHIGLSVDDVPVGWLVHLTHGLQDTGSVSIVNGDLIESATLASGPYAMRRAGRLGAWLSFDVREGSRATTGGQLAVSGTTSSFSMNGPIGSTQRGSWIASGRASYLQWLIKRLDPEAGATFGFSDVAAKAVYDVTPAQQVQGLLLAGRSRLEEQEDAPSPNSVLEAAANTGVGVVGWRSTYSRGTVTQRLAIRGGTFGNTGAYGQSLGSGHASGVSYLADLVADVGRGLSLRTGVETGRTREALALRQFSLSAPGVPGLRSEDAVRETVRTTYAYAGLGWQRGNAVVDAGAGVTDSSAISTRPVSAWAIGAAPMAGKFMLRAGARLAWQVPDAEQIGHAGGALAPERAVSIDLGIEHRLSDSVRWQATWFTREERDGLRLHGDEPRLLGGAVVPTDPAPRWHNALSTRARGVEFTLQRRAPTGLAGWVGYAFGRARAFDARTGETFWADFDQRHALTLYGIWRATPKTSVSGKLRVGSNFPLPGYFAGDVDTLALAAARNVVRLPAYARLDVRVNRVVTYQRRRLTLFVEVLNALARRNVGPTDGSVRTDGTLRGFTESLFPFVPSIGFVFEF